MIKSGRANLVRLVGEGRAMRARAAESDGDDHVGGGSLGALIRGRWRRLTLQMTLTHGGRQRSRRLLAALGRHITCTLMLRGDVGGPFVGWRGEMSVRRVGDELLLVHALARVDQASGRTSNIGHKVLGMHGRGSFLCPRMMHSTGPAARRSVDSVFLQLLLTLKQRTIRNR